jgi:hypothetical protein
MLFNVPGGTSRLGLPDTVTVPGLTGCFELPLTATGSGKFPSVFFEHLDHFPKFHAYCGCTQLRRSQKRAPDSMPLAVGSREHKYIVAGLPMFLLVQGGRPFPSIERYGSTTRDLDGRIGEMATIDLCCPDKVDVTAYARFAASRHNFERGTHEDHIFAEAVIQRAGKVFRPAL